MEFPYIKKLRTKSDTVNLALELSKTLVPGDLLCLNGNLGAGKTFLVKKILEFWGIDDASSPSFSIVNVHEGKYRVYHFDFYRLSSAEELLDIGFEDYLNDPDAVLFVEWASMLPEVLPKNRYELEIIFDEIKERKVVARKIGPISATLT